MKKNILSDEFYSDHTSQRFVEFIETGIRHLDQATVYYHYPMVRELDEGLKYPSILVISPNHGVMLFECDGINIVRGKDELDMLTSELRRVEDVIFSKMIKSPNKKLKSGKRDLSFNLCSALYAPNLENTDQTLSRDAEVEVLTSNAELKSFFEENERLLDVDVLAEVYAIIDNSTAIVKPKERKVSNTDTSSKAYILKKLEEEIAIFDEDQKYAALSQLNGPQRIRGLAGSGKTIILCMKAAILHLKYPDKRILYTFMTKSLYDYIELLITRFYKVLGDGKLPDFKDGISIQHAWGGDNLKGVYYEACKHNSVTTLRFREASSLAGRDDAFDYICIDLLEKTKGQLKKMYDYVLIDEAQDFKSSFYQVCRAIGRDDCIVWAYDDLQNIYDVNRQNTVDTFLNKFGAKGIDLQELQKMFPDMDNDIVLPKCYRNPREILVMAHAIGFGIYNDRLIQTLENNDHWEDLGYHVLEGSCKPGDWMIIERLTENSPLSLSKYQTPDDIIQYYSAEDIDDEVNWVCNCIDEAISQDGLRPDDVIVISVDDRNSKLYLKKVSDNLYERRIYSHNLSSNTYEKGFVEDERVTLSTVYKAKGHEAAMVFVMGTDVVELSKDTRRMRNKVFTAFTRTKAWLRVSGIDIEQGSLVQEITEVKRRGFRLEFEHKPAHVIQRDLAEVNAKKTRLRQQFEEFRSMLKKSGHTDDEIQEMMKEGRRLYPEEDPDDGRRHGE